LRPGQPVLTLGLPDEVAPVLASADRTTTVSPQVDSVLIFAANAAELAARLAQVKGAFTADPLVWVCYPKVSSGAASDLNRDRLWELLAPHALRPVAQVSVSEVWSALRFRRTGAS
jgi:hypothetical protein